MTDSTHPPAVRRLRRDSERGILGGVAAGIADYFQIDAAWVRGGFVLASLLGGLGFAVYVIGLLVMPRAQDDYALLPAALSRWTRFRSLVGLTLFAIGLLGIVGGPGAWLHGGLVGSALVMGLGAFILRRPPPPRKPPAIDAASSAASPRASDTASTGGTPPPPGSPPATGSTAVQLPPASGPATGAV
jgi:phage shock protein PspC (stress-responsive transcriptional regulator)